MLHYYNYSNDIYHSTCYILTSQTLLTLDQRSAKRIEAIDDFPHDYIRRSNDQTDVPRRIKARPRHQEQALLHV